MPPPAHSATERAHSAPIKSRFSTLADDSSVRSEPQLTRKESENAMTNSATTNRGRAFRMTFLLATLISAASLFAAAQPASAASTPKYCWHDSTQLTMLDVGLPLTYTTGITADIYVQRWNG